MNCCWAGLPPAWRRSRSLLVRRELSDGLAVGVQYRSSVTTRTSQHANTLGASMLTLRLTQTAEGPNRHRVQLDLEGDGAPVAATSEFDFVLADQDREDLRWYLGLPRIPRRPGPDH